MAKCSECAYLAVTMRSSGATVSPEVEYRQTGLIPVVPFGNGNQSVAIYTRLPFCVVRGKCFTDDLKSVAEHESPKRQDVLNREWDCRKFAEWEPGVAPLDHLEMLRDEKIRQWQAKQTWLMLGFGLLQTILGVLLGAWLKS